MYPIERIQLHGSPGSSYLPTAAQMSALDRTTIENGVPSLELMERAGSEVCSVLLSELKARQVDVSRGVILAGPGNNGGDGLVLARLLLEQNIKSTVYLFSSKRYSLELLTNLKRFGEVGGNVQLVGEPSDHIADLFTSVEPLQRVLQLVSQASFVVDALLGTGQQSAPRSEIGAFLSLFQEQTDRKPFCLSVDIPTGVHADTGQVYEPYFQSDTTVAIQLVKRGMTQYPAARACGEIRSVDIGISISEPPSYRLLCDDTYSFLLPVSSDQHKKSRGHLLIVAGSHSMPGALSLTTATAIQAGAGIVTAAYPDGTDTSNLPAEALRCELSEQGGCCCSSAVHDLRDRLSDYSALVVGPGLGRGPEVESFVLDLLSHAQEQGLTTVIDADALRSLPSDISRRRQVTQGTLLTPHPGEASHLLRISTDQVQTDRFRAAQELSESTLATVLLKGPSTVLFCRGEGRVSTAGTPHLGTAGSGDVLSGLLGALIGQTRDVSEAAYLGAYLHGKAAEHIYAEETSGPIAASQLIPALSFLIGKHQRFI